MDRQKPSKAWYAIAAFPLIAAAAFLGAASCKESKGEAEPINRVDPTDTPGVTQKDIQSALRRVRGVVYVRDERPEKPICHAFTYAQYYGATDAIVHCDDIDGLALPVYVVERGQ